MCLRPGAPDIMIVPSNLMAFAKRAGETLLVNPGRLSKGNTVRLVDAALVPMVPVVAGYGVKKPLFEKSTAMLSKPAFNV